MGVEGWGGKRGRRGRRVRKVRLGQEMVMVNTLNYGFASIVESEKFATNWVAF